MTALTRRRPWLAAPRRRISLRPWRRPRRHGRRIEGGGGAAPPRRRLHRARQGGRARHPQHGAWQAGVRREADQGRRPRRRQDRVPRVEPVPVEARGGHPGRRGEHLDGPRRQGAVPGRRVGHHRLARQRRRRPRGHRLRRRVLAPLGPRPHQHGQAPHERHPYHRGRAPPAQVPHARGHGGLHLRRCGAAGPGAHRRAQRPLLPQERRPLRHLHQGELHRLDGGARGRLRKRAIEAHGGELQAGGAADAGAVRARPRRRRRHVPRAQVSARAP
mmetsp:Transcript_24627/g.85667  ORF Transcript_24627/g.85667 Transcript_24627/m.85667 type:complete len:274 (-) Transcript_24627:253-1074(-)